MPSTVAANQTKLFGSKPAHGATPHGSAAHGSHGSKRSSQVAKTSAGKRLDQSVSIVDWLKMLIFIIAACAVIGILAWLSWFLNYESAKDALEVVGTEYACPWLNALRFMENVPAALEAEIKVHVDPIRVHMIEGMKLAHVNNDADNTKGMHTEEAIRYFNHLTATFFLTIASGTSCCSTMWTNMDMARETIDSFGGYAQFLANRSSGIISPSAYVADPTSPMAMTTASIHTHARRANELKHVTVGADANVYDDESHNRRRLKHWKGWVDGNVPPMNPTALNPGIFNPKSMETGVALVAGDSTLPDGPYEWILKDYEGTKWRLDAATLLPVETGTAPASPWIGLKVGSYGSHWESGWAGTIYKFDMQPGEFRFSPISLNKARKPYMNAVMPFYNTTKLPTAAQLAELKAGTLHWGHVIGGWRMAVLLPWLTAHLATLELKGGLLYLVERESGVFVASSNSSLSLGPAEDGDGPSGVPNALVQESAALLAPDGDWSGVSHTVQKATLVSKEQIVLTFHFAYEGIDWVGVYTVPYNNILSGLDDVASKQMAQTIGIQAGLLGFILLVVLAWFTIRSSRLRAHQRAYSAYQKERISRASMSSRECKYSLCAIRLDELEAMGKIPKHEEALEKGKLKFFHNLADAKSFFSNPSNKLIFISHQWLGWSLPDPNNAQYPLMIDACLRLANGMDKKNVYVWVDFTCVPQANPFIQLLAIETLHVYTTVCNHFVIIAPSTKHADSGVDANVETYFSRGWCRLEQYSRLMGTHGKLDMNICTTIGAFDQVSDLQTQLKSALFVFNGSFTCCALDHPNGMQCDKMRLTDAMLGLYCSSGLSEIKKGTRPVATEMETILKGYLKSSHDEIFPPEFFGNLLEVADMMDAEDLAEAALGMSEPSIVSQSSMKDLNA